MQIAILTVSSLALGVGIINLAIMAKTAKELHDAKLKIDQDVEAFKQKTDRNIKKLRSTINDLEM